MNRLVTAWRFQLRIFACWFVTGSVVGVLICPASRALADAPPESVLLDRIAELYEPVEFSHAMHADVYDCSRCHHHTAGTPTEDGFCGRCHQEAAAGVGVACNSCHATGPASPAYGGKMEEQGRYHIDTPSLKGAIHLLCRNCHLEESGPTACLDCHDYSDAGRKRFLVKD